MNVIEILKGLLGKDFANVLGRVLGIDASSASKALEGALPLLLAMFAKQSSMPDGARRLDAAVNQADSDILGNLSGALTNPQNATQGKDLLTSLLGDTVFTKIAGVLGQFAGMNGMDATKLFALLTPVLLGFLKGKKQEMGLDAGGLAGLLAGQQKNIASALPTDLKSMLPNMPDLGLDEVAGQVAGRTYEAGRATANAAKATARSVADTGQHAASATSSLLTRVLPVLLLLLLAGGVWAAVRGCQSGEKPVAVTVKKPVVDAATATNSAANEAKKAISDAAPSLPDLATITGRAGDFFQQAPLALAKISDAAAAKEALPKIAEMTRSLDQIGGATMAWPAASRDKITQTFQKSNAGVMDEINRVMKLPDLGSETKWQYAQLRDRMYALGGDGTYFVKQATGFVTQATTALESIKDPASAEAALPELRNLSSHADSLAAALSLLPESLRSSIRQALAGVNQLVAMIDSVSKIPGVGDKIREVAAPLRASLVSLTKV